jgi:hypothetical protein
MIPCWDWESFSSTKASKFMEAHRFRSAAGRANNEAVFSSKWASFHFREAKFRL